MSRCYALPICVRVGSDVLLFIPTTLYFDTYDITSSQRQQRILDKEKREKRRRLTTRQTARRQHLKIPLYPFLTQAFGPKSSAVLSSPNQTSSPLSRLVACRTILLQGYNSSLRLRMYALYALSVFARPSGAQLHASHGALINLCIVPNTSTSFPSVRISTQKLEFQQCENELSAYTERMAH
jgi:hypothetical protein